MAEAELTAAPRGRRLAEELREPPPTPEQRAAPEAELARVIAAEGERAEAERERRRRARAEYPGLRELYARHGELDADDEAAA